MGYAQARVFVLVAFCLSTAGCALGGQRVDLGRLPPVSLEPGIHIGELNLFVDCGFIAGLPTLPAGWSASIETTDRGQQLALRFTADVIEVSDFNSLRNPAGSIPRIVVELSEPECSRFEVVVQEAVEGTVVNRCGGAWAYESEQRRWSRLECLE